MNLTTKLLLFGQFFISLVVFLVDLSVSQELTIGIFYALNVLYSWLLPYKYTTIYTAILSTLLVIVGFIMSEPVNSDFTGLNFVFSILIIWIVAAISVVAQNAINSLEKTRVYLDNRVAEQTIDLKKTNQQLQHMVDVVQEYSIILLDLDGHVLTWNKGAERIFGYKEREVLGRSNAIFFNKEDVQNHKHKTLLANALKHGTTQDKNLRIRKDGDDFYADVIITTFYDVNEKPAGFTKVTRDITTINRLQEVQNEQIALVAKNQELEKFAFHVSHDLQEPLRTIQSYIDILFEEYENQFDQFGNQYLATIKDAATRMRFMIKGLLDFSRLTQDSVKQKIDLSSLINQIVNDRKKQIRSCKAQVKIGRLHSFKGFIFPIQQMCSNLISNAIKFSRTVETPIVEIYSTLFSDHIEIVIRDNGIGIEQKYFEQIFELFTKLNPSHKYEGSGLGLAQCKSIVDMHNGSICVNSVPGEGSEFRVKIPFEETTKNEDLVISSNYPVFQHN